MTKTTKFVRFCFIYFITVNLFMKPSRFGFEYIGRAGLPIVPNYVYELFRSPENKLILDIIGIDAGDFHYFLAGSLEFQSCELDSVIKHYKIQTEQKI